MTAERVKECVNLIPLIILEFYYLFEPFKIVFLTVYGVLAVAHLYHNHLKIKINFGKAFCIVVGFFVVFDIKLFVKR